MSNDTEECFYSRLGPSPGDGASMRNHGPASRRVTAIREDARPELGVPGKWPSRTLPEGHFRGGNASAFSPLFFGSGPGCRILSTVVAGAGASLNVMQRRKMQSRAGRGDVHVCCRTVGRPGPGCNHHQGGC